MSDFQNNYKLWFHPESDCYFWLPEEEDPDDPFCHDVTGIAGHEEMARRLGVKEPEQE